MSTFSGLLTFHLDILFEKNENIWDTLLLSLLKLKSMI